MRQDFREEQLRPIAPGAAEELVLRRVLDDLALVHEDHAVRDLAGETHLVGDDHHGHAFAGEVDHDVEHLADHFRIERRGWLVEQHQLGLERERARDCHPLLLAAEKLGRIGARLLGKIDAIERREREALGLTYAQSMRYVVLPQAFRNMLPVLLTQTIVLFQDTSLVYVLSIPDFLGAASKVAQRDGRLVEMYLFAALVYFIISCIGSFGVRRLQARIAVLR